MPQFRISSGLAPYPEDATDKEANLVNPIYGAVNSLAEHISMETGNVVFTQSELAQISQLTKLRAARTQKLIVRAAEALGFGQLVTISVGGGRIEARVATATDVARPAHGICDTPQGIPLNQFGEIILLQGHTTGVTGTIFGTTYYLATAGAASTVAPAADGVLSQVIGIGLGSEGLYLNIEPIARRPTHFRRDGANIRVNFADGSHLVF